MNLLGDEVKKCVDSIINVWYNVFKRQKNYCKIGGKKMVRVVFEYMDRYTNGEWRKQRCIVESVEKCKEIYGLGIDCDYRIISVEEV